MSSVFFSTFDSNFGEFIIVWEESQFKTLIQRIFLSDQRAKSVEKLKTSFIQITEKSNEVIVNQGRQIQKFLLGEQIDFDLNFLDFNLCSKTQKKVLLAEFNIPRGWVSTYKRIAEYIGIRNGARVIGNSLAKNPFPIYIPCHRAIRSDGKLGGYQGGLEMKKVLLEFEGIQVSENGKVLTDKIHY